MTLAIGVARKALGDPAVIVFPESAERSLRGGGLPLADLLGVTLTRNAHVRVLLEHVSGHWFQDWSSMVENRPHHCDARAMLDGLFLEHQPAWPAALARYDLFVEWCDRSGSRFAEIAPIERTGRLAHLAEHNPAAEELLEDIQGIARVVRDRYEALMTLLRSGILEAHGHAMGSGQPARILPGVWSQPKTRIDFVESEIHRLVHVGVERTGNWAPSRVERTEVMWSGVVVQRVSTVEPAKPDTVEQIIEKDKGGKPPEYLWDEAYERLVIMLGNEGFPASGIKADLARMFIDCFQSIAGAKWPSEGAASDWLRDNHLPVWNAVKAASKPAPKRRPVK